MIRITYKPNQNLEPNYLQKPIFLGRRHACETNNVIESTYIRKKMKRMIEPAVRLTDTERKIFDVFLNTCAKYELKTTLRVAGGWVRDKLMGFECHDMDIAVQFDIYVGFFYALTM
jgi:hypothetical protein